MTCRMSNLFHDPAYQEKKEELRALTFEWMGKYNDQFWGVDDFLRVRPAETWMYNYEKSPYELFLEEERGDKSK